MNPNKPLFKIGDKLQCVSTPSELEIVTNVQRNTDGSGNFYTLQTPAEVERVLPTSHVDQYHVKNARAFNQEYNRLNEEPPTPGFDKDGLPTFEEDYK